MTSKIALRGVIKEFGTHRVLRGGCWQTRARLLRSTWRNFYPPDRRDVWAGFRTCARDA